jgi:heme oxygenase
MLTPGTTLAHLDRETAPFHADAGRAWTLLRGTESTRADYARQLAVTYGLEAPFEAACAYTPGLSQVIDLRGRARSGLIAQDLLTLGWTPERITSLNTYRIVPFQDATEALGWIYVIERAAFVYEDVRDALVTRFHDLGRAVMYLGAYEKQMNRRWADLGTALDRVATSDGARDRVLEAAKDAFEARVEWQRSHGPMLRSVG